MNMRRLDSSAADFHRQLSRLLATTDEPDADIRKRVEAILADVRERGDAALLEYTNRFDKRDAATVNELVVSPDRLAAAVDTIDADLVAALQEACRRVRDYHQKQKAESWTYIDADGNELGQKVTPLDRVGVYVPGGKAAYPSSVLMNVIPAQVAGVSEIIMVVPMPGGIMNPTVLAAAHIVGVETVIAIGGAQAVAALAYGTETVPRVDKIVGPGNIYVATAKRMVFGTVGIDMIAGPSEVLVVCDSGANPDWIAMDLFAQAEHDEHACSILVCPDAAFLDRVEHSIERLLPEMERADIIRASLAANGALIRVRDLDEAADVVNRVAPEHLELALSDPDPVLADIRHAGAIFIGHYAAESLGDYCAGPNHVLPTARSARFSSPLGVYDFQKRSSLIRCTQTSAAVLARTATVLARGEGLTAHARSAEYRLKSGSK